MSKQYGRFLLFVVRLKTTPECWDYHLLKREVSCLAEASGSSDETKANTSLPPRKDPGLENPLISVKNVSFDKQQ
jgi:hypothetical protein